MDASRGQDDASFDQVRLITYLDDVISDRAGVIRDQVNLIGGQVDVIADRVGSERG